MSIEHSIKTPDGFTLTYKPELKVWRLFRRDYWRDPPHTVIAEWKEGCPTQDDVDFIITMHLGKNGGEVS